MHAYSMYVHAYRCAYMHAYAQGEVTCNMRPSDMSTCNSCYLEPPLQCEPPPDEQGGGEGVRGSGGAGVEWGAAVQPLSNMSRFTGDDFQVFAKGSAL